MFPIHVMDGNKINTLHFDHLMELVLELPADTHAVIDNGASTFVPLSSYIAENCVADLLAGSGHTLILHTVLTGGQAKGDTEQGLSSLLNNFTVPISLQKHWGLMITSNFAEFTLIQVTLTCMLPTI